MESNGKQASGERILVVDDIPTNVRLLEAYLGSIGFEVLTAASGLEALKRIEEHPPDLVLLDIMMPELDGFATCARIRSNPRTRHIPVILLTSLTATESKVRGQEVGADDFVSKPFDKMELLVRVKSMLRVKSLHDQLTQKVSELEDAKGRLKQLADTDELTLLRNRRYFRDHLSREMRRAERYSQDLSIALLDVDHFKKVNDTHGHPTGDAVLQQLATMLNRCVRRIDVAARYGGEEFALILPETPKSGAEFLARSLRERIAENRFRGARGQVLDQLTISVGVATYPEDATEQAALIDIADRRLYTAKDAGRNRVVADDFVTT